MKSPVALARELRKNQTPEEKILWDILRNRKLIGYKFKRQHPIIYKQVNNTKRFFILDFYCPNKNIAIELDGKQHIENAEYDKERNVILFENKIKVLRIKNEELRNNEACVIERIIAAFK